MLNYHGVKDPTQTNAYFVDIQYFIIPNALKDSNNVVKGVKSHYKRIYNCDQKDLLWNIT